MKKFNKKKELKSEKVDSSELGKYYDEEVLKKAKKARRQKIWKIVQRVVIGVVASTVICSTARNIFISGRSYFKNSDLIPQVTSELCTDMDMMHYEKYNNQIIRLKPNDDGNVCVYIADNVPQRAQQNIKSSLNYFNEIFDNVNDKFNFTVGNKAEYVADRALQNSTIKFEYKTLDEGTYGFNSHSQSLFDFPKKIFPESANNGKYCISSTISLNDRYFDKLDDKMQQFTIRHEMLHSLGFDDVYTNNYTEFATIMNVDNFYITNEISPSDMRRLYTAYCEKYVNSDKTLNYEKLAEVKEYLNNYETQYYQNVAEVLKDSFAGECYNITDEELAGFTAGYGLLDVKVNANGKYEYVYNKNAQDPSKLFAGSGTVVKGDNYAILPKIEICGFTRYYIILKDTNGLNMYYVNLDKTPIKEKISLKANIVLRPAVPYTSYNYTPKTDDTMQR